MPANDFEKQVQQIFEDLRMKPSQEVWPKVEERIKKDKRRRRFIIWLPLLTLLLGAGGYWLFQNDASFNHQSSLAESQHQLSSSHNTPKESSRLNQENKPVLKENQPAKQTIASSSFDKQENSTNAVAPEENTNTNKSAASVIKPKAQTVLNTASEHAPEQSVANANISAKNSRPVAFKNKQALIRENSSRNKLAVKLTQEDHASNATKDRVLDNDIKEIASTYRLPLKPALQTIEETNSLLPEINAEKTLQPSSSTTPATWVALNAPLEKSPVKLAKKKTWEWGVDGSVGISKVGSGLSGIFKGSEEKAMVYTDLLTNGSSNIGNLVSQNNNYLAAVRPPASDVKPGIAWNAGLFGKWHFNNRLALTTGIGYAYFSTSRKVGYITPDSYYNGVYQDVTTRFAGLYGGGYSNDYTNKYHIIQIPVGIQWQVNKGIKLPLQVDAGVNIGWLANTNALHYDETYGTYYEDKSLFNKIQAGLYAGISAKLFQHSKRPLYIGPVFQYNLSNIVKSPAAGAQNFIYGGIKVAWVLRKK